MTAIFFVSALLFGLHPIHVSVTEIEFDDKDQALEIMMRIFIDDLELSLKNSTRDPNIDLLGQSQVQNDKLIKAYIRQHFALSLDGRKSNVNYLGYEQEAEAFIVYLEVSKVTEWQTVKVFNDIIMATYDDQSNLVHVYVGDEVKSLRLTADTPSKELSFK